jgi:hypothetical protein
VGPSVPRFFGVLVESGVPSNVASGYGLGALAMIFAGVMEVLLGVQAEQEPLEEVAAPLSAEDGSTAQESAPLSGAEALRES